MTCTHYFKVEGTTGICKLCGLKRKFLGWGELDDLIDKKRLVTSMRGQEARMKTFDKVN